MYPPKLTRPARSAFPLGHSTLPGSWVLTDEGEELRPGVHAAIARHVAAINIRPARPIAVGPQFESIAVGGPFEPLGDELEASRNARALRSNVNHESQARGALPTACLASAWGVSSFLRRPRGCGWRPARAPLDERAW